MHHNSTHTLDYYPWWCEADWRCQEWWWIANIGVAFVIVITDAWWWCQSELFENSKLKLKLNIKTEVQGREITKSFLSAYMYIFDKHGLFDDMSERKNHGWTGENQTCKYSLSLPLSLTQKKYVVSYFPNTEPGASSTLKVPHTWHRHKHI
jgi:hypothetical protein